MLFKELGPPLKEYAVRRLGEEAYNYLVDPFHRGSYIASADEMSVVDFFFLTNNFFGASAFTFLGGVGALPKAVAGHLDVRLGARVNQVGDMGGEVKVTWTENDQTKTEHADYVVIALPSQQMTGIYPQLDQGRREAVSSLKFSYLMTVNVALNKPTKDKSFLVAIPEVESDELCAIFVDHNKHPGRVPSGKGLLTYFWHDNWNRRHWESSDEEIVEKTIAEGKRFLPETDDVQFAQVNRFYPAVMLSWPGMYKTLNDLAESRKRDQRVQLAGDYFGGSTTNSALCSGEYAAKRVQEVASQIEKGQSRAA